MKNNNKCKKLYLRSASMHQIKLTSKFWMSYTWKLGWNKELKSFAGENTSLWGQYKLYKDNTSCMRQYKPIETRWYKRSLT